MALVVVLVLSSGGPSTARCLPVGFMWLERAAVILLCGFTLWHVQIPYRGCWAAAPAPLVLCGGCALTSLLEEAHKSRALQCVSTMCAAG